MPVSPNLSVFHRTHARSDINTSNTTSGNREQGKSEVGRGSKAQPPLLLTPRESLFSPESGRSLSQASAADDNNADDMNRTTEGSHCDLRALAASAAAQQQQQQQQPRLQVRWERTASREFAPLFSLFFSLLGDDDDDDAGGRTKTKGLQ